MSASSEMPSNDLGADPKQRPSVRLRVSELSKSFGSVRALKSVNFDLRPGEVHALCGENGAGKSTLIKLLGGVYAHGSYEGTIEVEGKEAKFQRTKDAEAAGICVIHQELMLVSDMTVAENLALGALPTRHGLVDWDKVYEDARRTVERARIDIDVRAKITDLGVGRRQLAEIAKAVGKRSRVLILDEPTAALTEREVEHLLELVKSYRDEGISCVYISHKLDEVFAVADRITVLRDGSSIVTKDAQDLTQNDIIRYMVGREVDDLFPRRKSEPKEPMLRVKNLNVGRRKGDNPVLKDISFEVRAGEVLGIGGLMGAGRSEILMHLFGAFGSRISGEVELAGEKIGPLPPSQIIDKGLALVSEDRKRYGLVLAQTIGEQMALSSLSKYQNWGLLDHDRLFQDSRAMFQSLRVKATDLEVVVGTLSGGNQQKVVIGKALLTEPKVLLLDEPTRGIDIGAKLEVYELMNRLTAEGKAVILVSSELPELMGMSDRIIMLFEGRITGEFRRGEFSQEKLLAAALGHSSIPTEAPTHPHDFPTHQQPQP